MGFVEINGERVHTSFLSDKNSPKPKVVMYMVCQACKGTHYFKKGSFMIKCLCKK